ncbi:MAG: DUF721 domain-containing protein [Victivallales bacterium]|nr:DUF721 domain-containing protein [Victivallales bacterium]
MEDEKLKSLHLKRNGWLSRKDNRQAGEFYGIPSAREREREAVIEDWVGEERRAEVFASFRPEPVAIGSVAASIVSSVSVQQISLLDSLKKDWESIVGAVNVKQCQPCAISGSLLRIEVYASTWLYILKSQSKIIQGRVEAYSNGAIKAVAFMAARANRKERGIFKN